ncbi:MAG TPA: sensor histidine kinase [Intrasporangiaceae bacterium]|nr:sensor histidine kinase [Intrasporangiaceae bacterium]
MTRGALDALGGPTDPTADHAERIRHLTDSRRRIVDAFEIERARIERDLHDGAQQFLVAASLKVGEAALALDHVTTTYPQDHAARTAAHLLDQAQDDTASALAALRETVAGVHSHLLTEQGLEPALRELCARFSRGERPVTLRIPHPLPALPDGVASAAWFFTAEALTNATKHAPTAPVSVVVAADRTLHVTVVDEGPGGADFVPGHGLAGMRERLSAFGGTMTIASPSGGPTTVSARIPLLLNAAHPALTEESP